jgi:two-component system sensor histidine kinase HydH
MVREVDRLNRVISDLLEFARPSDIKPADTDLKPLLEHSLRLVGQDAGLKGVAVELHVDGELPRVGLDADRFSQALLNLYLNAIQAMDRAGDGAGGTLSVRAWAEAGRVCVEIADTGRGIEPADIPHIFDPYYTTKPSGTGLGLAIVHKIVEAHGGSVAVRSEPGRGTAVTVAVPAPGSGAVGGAAAANGRQAREA